MKKYMNIEMLGLKDKLKSYPYQLSGDSNRG